MANGVANFRQRLFSVSFIPNLSHGIISFVYGLTLTKV